MTRYSLSILPKAFTALQQAVNRYNLQEVGLGDKF